MWKEGEGVAVCGEPLSEWGLNGMWEEGKSVGVFEVRLREGGLWVREVRGVVSGEEGGVGVRGDGGMIGGGERRVVVDVGKVG